MPLDVLRQLIVEYIEKTNDADLLDFILKLLFSQGGN